MADQKISDLTAVVTPTGADLLEVVQAGNNLKMTLAQLLAMGSSPGAFGAITVTTIGASGTVTSTRSAAGDLSYVAKVTGDGQNRFECYADGKQKWGDGSAALDCTAEREATGILKITAGLKATYFHVSKTSSAAEVYLDANAGQYRRQYFRTGTSSRWVQGADNASEAGSDAGSDWILAAFTDAGASIGNALKVTRATMAAVFGGSLKSTGDFTVGASKLSVVASTGSLSSAGTIAAALGAWFRTTAMGLTATTGHFYVPTCPGVPTGVPEVKTGQVALQYDTANDDLYVYNAGWQKIALT